MKKTYIRPEIEITAFTTEDIITSSGLTAGGMKSGGSLNADSNTSIEIDLSKGEWK